MWDVKIKMALIPARGAREGKCLGALWARTLSVGDLRIFSFSRSDPHSHARSSAAQTRVKIMAQKLLGIVIFASTDYTNVSVVKKEARHHF